MTEVHCVTAGLAGNHRMRSFRHLRFTVSCALSIFVFRGMMAMRVLSPYLLTAVFVVISASAHAATPAETFVQQNLDCAYAIVQDTSLATEQRNEKFRALVAGILDARRVAVFTLGPYARMAPATELEAFVSVFGNFVTAVIQHDLAGNPVQTLTVTGSVVRAPDDVIVKATLTGSARANGQPVNMGFRIRKSADGADRLVDLEVEGISLAASERSDFTSRLQRRHGDVAALTRELQGRIKQLSEDDAIAEKSSAATPG